MTSLNNINGLLILLLVLILYTVYRRVEKIYYLIWSDYEYLKRIKEKSNNPCSFQEKSVSLQQICRTIQK